MILGHASLTAAGHRLAGGRWPWLASLPLGWVLLGAYVPDLADKSACLLLGLSGRGYAHSLVVQAALLGPLLLLLTASRRRVLAVWLGASIHLVQDWVELPVLLAPLLGPIPEGEWNALSSIWGFYSGGGPLVWLELAALLYWAGVAVRLASAAPQPVLLVAPAQGRPDPTERSVS